MPTLSSLVLLALTTVLSLSFTTAQYDRYTSGPIIAHTFDSRPDLVANGRTTFQWSTGRAPNLGLAQFVNGSRIDLLTFPDDNGKLFPRYLPQTLTFEFWAMYQTLGFWSRLIDCGNGANANNVFMSNMATGSTPNNNFHAAFYSGQNSQSATANNAVHPNSFQHFVATITRRGRGNNQAIIELYVDGIKRADQNATVMNANIERTQCWLGYSNWKENGDEDLRGYIDDFFYYDYPLSSEAVLAHFVVNRPPVYELTFSTDPRLVLGYGAGGGGRPAQFFSYNWTNIDERDSSNITKYHDGHLVLKGDSFVDLSAPNDGGDGTSIGAAPIPTIGGVSGGDGMLAGGWSFEILFKADTIEQWAKVFDCGNGRRKNNILLGYEWTTSRLRLEQYIGQDEQFMALNAVESLELNVWYHIVVVFQRERWDRIDTHGSVKIYVNGNLTGNATNALMPLPVQRTTCYIGKSHWVEDEYFDMMLDSFRLYDYALQQSDVSMLYLITHSPLPTDLPNAAGEHADHWHSQPIASYTFARPATAIEQQLGSHYNWTQGTYSATTFPHLGVATFSGAADQFVNLMQYDMDQGGTIPLMIGGEMSIECWARWTGGTSNWQRILDLGGWQGSADSNIILSAGQTIDELVFEVYSGVASSGARQQSGIYNYQWMHIVAVAQQLNIADAYSSTAAVLRIYVNGQYVANSLGYVPPRVARPSSYIGHSNWVLDSPFQGQIDSVHIYDRALDYEEVRAHYISFVPPVFELAFARDPIPWLGLDRNDPYNQITYSWEAYDPADQAGNATNFHNGHLVLAPDGWVNLSTNTGPTSVGTHVPLQLFGAAASIGGQYAPGLIGWSIELTFKPLNKPEDGAKIFDFGNGPAQDNVGLQYDWDQGGALSMFIYRGTQSDKFIVVSDVKMGVWYHIIITMRPLNDGSGRGSYAAYIDGEYVSLDTTNLYPQGVIRRSCLLGWSNWRDDFFDIKLDTFRIYNYIIQPGQAADLYAVTTSPLTGVIRPVYQTDPMVSYSFNIEPDNSWLGYDTKYEWRQGNQASGHVGLAHFNGQDEWINLLTYPDDRDTVLPPMFGNTSLSFEGWVRFDSLKRWSRIFDFGQDVQSDNILFGNYIDTPRLALHVYLGTDGTNTQLNTAQNVWIPGVWQHFVVTIEDMAAQRRVARNSQQAAEYRIYINGTQIANMSGVLPARAARQFSYMANSNWRSNGDELFNGTIDEISVYNYALSDEQIKVRFLLPKWPVFDLSFSADPRTVVPSLGQPATYTWQNYDPNDNYANNALYHGGHLVLNGSRNSFVNLSAPQGGSSVGVVLPRFGGESQGIGLYTNPQQLGWSFEFIVKLTGSQTWAKLIDWGNGPGLDNIILGYRDQLQQLDFEVWNPQRDTEPTRFTVIPQVVPNFWYHIVVVLIPIDVTGGTATYQSYVDGRLTATANGWLPRSVRRNRAYIGRSNWQETNNDGMFAANVDAIRVYDYALTSANVQALYSLANDPNGTPRPEPGTMRSSSSSSSSTAGSTGVVRRSSSSSSSSRRVVVTCPYWAEKVGNRCYCPEDASGDSYYPDCYCPAPLDDGNHWIPYDCPWMYPNPDDPIEYSSTGAAAVTESGMGTATIAAIIFAVVLVAAIAAFVYYKYFRQPATTQNILGLGNNGVPSSGGGKERLLSSTDVSSSHMAHQSTNGHSSNGTNGASQPTGLDYYLTPDPHTQPQSQHSSATGGLELPNV